jgi:hypothetical protein
MKYIVRLNPKAWNPITNRVEPSRLWEVEQCATKDSEKVIWHRANVRIGERGINELFVLQKPGEAPTELHFEGIIVGGGQDNALVIVEGRHDVFN